MNQEELCRAEEDVEMMVIVKQKNVNILEKLIISLEFALDQ